MVWSKVVCPGADSVIQTDTVSGRDSMLIRVPSGDMSCPDWLSRDVVPLGFLLIKLLSFVDSPTAAGFGCWPSGCWSEELAAMLLDHQKLGSVWAPLWALLWAPLWALQWALLWALQWALLRMLLRALRRALLLGSAFVLWNCRVLPVWKMQTGRGCLEAGLGW